MPRNKRTGNAHGDYQDSVDRVLLWRGDHAHTKPFIIFVRIGVLDKYKLSVPVDSVVVGATESHGEVYLKIQVVPTKHDILVDRYFYVLDHDRVMQYPNLGFLCEVKVGGKDWLVFEDDVLI